MNFLKNIAKTVMDKVPFIKYKKMSLFGLNKIQSRCQPSYDVFNSMIAKMQKITSQNMLQLNKKQPKSLLYTSICQFSKQKKRYEKKDQNQKKKELKDSDSKKSQLKKYQQLETDKLKKGQEKKSTITLCHSNFWGIDNIQINQKNKIIDFIVNKQALKKGQKERMNYLCRVFQEVKVTRQKYSSEGQKINFVFQTSEQMQMMTKKHLKAITKQEPLKSLLKKYPNIRFICKKVQKGKSMYYKFKQDL